MNDFEIDNTGQCGEIGIVEYKDWYSKEPLHFENGGVLPEYNIRYETYGKLNADKSNAILVCHALTGDHHLAGVYGIDDKKTGWWNNLIGVNKPLDTEKYFIIGTNCIGGCQGSTGPSSINPATGKRWNLDFPVYTIKDMVNAQARLLDFLGIKKLKAVLGGSMGGMQVLEWAVSFPDRLERAIALATTSRQNAQAIAFNEVGRHSIKSDLLWNNGNYEPDNPPAIGLSVARMMAHITYLSDKGMEDKFGRELNIDINDPFAPSFQVERYLHYQGKSFVNRFDANTYLYLTKALDLFDLKGECEKLEEALIPITAKVLIVGFTSDWLFLPEQNKEIVQALLRAKKQATYVEIESDLGHDSFLTHSPKLYGLIESFLDV